VGGIFSGRKPAQNTKPSPEEFITLDVRELRKEGGLAPKQSYNLHKYSCGLKMGILAVTTRQDRLSLQYTAVNEQNRQCSSQSVAIDWTPCHFGGRRPWFVCPNESCDKRVAILYGPHRFLCRNCHGIAYQSQRETEIQRLIRKMETLRAKFSGPTKTIGSSQELSRPKGMHQQTFELLDQRHRLLASEISLKQVRALIELDAKVEARLSKINAL